MNKTKALMINIGRGMLLCGAFGGFIAICICRIFRPLHMPPEEFIISIGLYYLIGFLIGAIPGGIFGFLPTKKWNPIKKVHSKEKRNY